MFFVDSLCFDQAGDFKIPQSVSGPTLCNSTALVCLIFPYNEIATKISSPTLKFIPETQIFEIEICLDPAQGSNPNGSASHQLRHTAL